MMKVIAINGSPRKNGNTSQILDIVVRELAKQDIETEIIQIGHQAIHGCIGCGYCKNSNDNHCVIQDDIVNETAAKMRAAAGFILASPTYYGGITGSMKCLLDRVFYSSARYFRYKVATSLTVVRRAGGVETVHQLNNYLHLAQTILPPSQYWTVAYGMKEGEALQDKEGIQTIRKNAQGMAWLLKIIEAGQDKVPIPFDEERIKTNFIN